MKFEDLHYYKLNQMLLFLIGVGTERDSWPIKAFRFLYFLTLIVSIIYEIFMFTTPCFVLDDFLMNIPNLLIVLVAALKYAQFSYKVNAIRIMKEYITEDWRNLRDIEELRIMKEYARRTQLMTMGFAFVVYAAVVPSVMVVLTPAIFDIILPLNKSRDSGLFEYTKYYIPTADNNLFVALLFTVGAFATGTTIIATEAMANLIVEHICALMKIASCRFQDALNHFALPNPEPGYDAISRRKIAEAVQIHSTAIDFVEFMKSTLIGMYFVLLIIAVFAISTNLYRLTQALVRYERNFVVLLFLSICVQMAYLIITNYAGQKVIDHSSNILGDIYVTPWYMTPTSVQKLLLIIMMRSLKQCTLIVGGIFIPSFEGFSTICSMSFSYFTVIYSMQT